jgi:hypothetical protein
MYLAFFEDGLILPCAPQFNIKASYSCVVMSYIQSYRNRLLYCREVKDLIEPCHIFEKHIKYVILSRVRVTLDGVLNWIFDLLNAYTHNTEQQAITVQSLISALYKSPQHRLSPVTFLTVEIHQRPRSSPLWMAAPFQLTLFFRASRKKWLVCPRRLPCNPSARSTQTTFFILVW